MYVAAAVLGVVGSRKRSLNQYFEAVKEMRTNQAVSKATRTQIDQFMCWFKVIQSQIGLPF